MSTGDCCMKEEMGCSEGKIVLVITGEGEAEGRSCTVRGELNVMNKATVWFLYAQSRSAAEAGRHIV